MKQSEKQTKKYPKGFTLIELLVVVLIIGILAAVALPQYQKAAAKAKTALAIAYVREVAKQQRLYFTEHGVYASSIQELPAPPVLPKGWGLHEWLPSLARLCLITTDTQAYIYSFYTTNPETIHCKAYKTAPLWIEACSAVSGGNEDTTLTDSRRVFIIQ